MAQQTKYLVFLKHCGRRPCNLGQRTGAWKYFHNDVVFLSVCKRSGSSSVMELKGGMRLKLQFLRLTSELRNQTAKVPLDPYIPSLNQSNTDWKRHF